MVHGWTHGVGIGEAHVDWLVADPARVTVSLIELRRGDRVCGPSAGVATTNVNGPLSPPVTLMLPKVDILAALATRHRTHIQGALTQALVVHRAVSARIAGLPAAFYETWAFRVHIYGQFRAWIPVAPVPVVVAPAHAASEDRPAAVLDLALSAARQIVPQRHIGQRVAVLPDSGIVAGAVPVRIVLPFASRDRARTVPLPWRTTGERVAVPFPALVVRGAPPAPYSGPLASVDTA